MIQIAAAASLILVIAWPDGSVTRENALNYRTCSIAAQAAVAGRGLPLDRRRVPSPVRSQPALWADCVAPEPGEGFPAGWDQIQRH